MEIGLTISLNFNSSKVMTNNNLDVIIEELFDSILPRYQIGLNTQMRGSEFIFDCVNLLYYKCHRINFKHNDSNINFSD